MYESPLRRRLPVLILLGLITLVSVADWIHDFSAWTMVPAEVTEAWKKAQNGELGLATWIPLTKMLSAALLHADSSHLIGNLFFLWIFGVVVFDLCGWPWMLLVYGLSALGGSLGQTLLETTSVTPVLGASGALMGLEGFYFGLATQKERPDSELWPLSRPVNSKELAAAALIGVILDLMGILGGGQGIAYGAHLGGFITGMALSLIAKPSA